MRQREAKGQNLVAYTKEIGSQNHYPDLGDWFCHALHFKQNAALRQCGIYVIQKVI
jgi:hypothetical protein